MHPIIFLLDLILSFYSFLVFLYVLIQLLGHFEVINRSSPAVVKIMQLLASAVEPALNKIRKYLKPYNNIDWSPAALLIALYFIQYCIRYYFGY